MRRRASTCGRRAAPRAALSPAQIRWLGVFLFATQLPQVPFVPMWVAGFGMMLVGLRLAFLHRDRSRADAKPARIPSWALALFAVAAGFAIRQSFGVFLGRDPCVAFLFVLAGIKYLEARTARDGTLLVCLACFEVVTPFFYSQSVLGRAGGAAFARGARDHAAGAGPAGAVATCHLPSGGRRSPRTARLFAQGIPLAALLFVLFPRLAGPLWGLPADAGARSGLSDRMAPGSISELSLDDSVAFRVDFDNAVPPPAQRYWRGPVLSRFDGREWSALERRAPRVPRPAGRTISYSVTLEPHWKPWLFALELPARAPASDLDGGVGGSSSARRHGHR